MHHPQLVVVEKRGFPVDRIYTRAKYNLHVLSKHFHKSQNLIVIQKSEHPPYCPISFKNSNAAGLRENRVKGNGLKFETAINLFCYNFSQRYKCTYWVFVG